MNNEQKLQQAFAEALGLPDGTHWESLKYRGVEAWDSVAHMALVGELEASFDVMFDTEEVIAMSSYPKARELLGGHGVAF